MPERALRWRGTIGCLVGSLALTVVCLVPLRTVVRQAGLIVPQSAKVSDKTWQVAFQVLKSDPDLDATRHQLRALESGEPTDGVISSWSAGNPPGSLPTYARLLVHLRRRQASTQPADQPPPSETEILDILHGLPTAPPLRLRLTRQREQVVAVLHDRGLGAREAESIAYTVHWVQGGIAESCRPVIRELCDRLLTEAEAWRIEGRPDDARLADEAVVRLLTDIVRDSPMPDVALLAVERLPAALRDLGAENEAAAAESFRTRYHASIGVDETSLLPNFGGPPLAAKEHDRALKTLLQCVLSLTAACILASFCFVFLLLVLMPVRGAGQLAWRSSSRIFAAVLGIVSPLVVMIIGAAGLESSVSWLFSSRSLVCLLFLPPMFSVLIILMTRLAMIPPPAIASAKLSRRVIVSGLIVLGVAIVLSAIFAPIQPEPWRPPRELQWLRRFGLFVAVACTAVSLFWLVWGARTRRKGGMPRGQWARANLAVTSYALVAVVGLTMASLIMNSRLDSRHEEAFAKAAVDPIADRLGPDWGEKHFALARALIE